MLAEGGIALGVLNEPLETAQQKRHLDGRLRDVEAFVAVLTAGA
jgi:hypothetical protein